MLKSELVLAARILARQGLASGPFGNLSVRAAESGPVRDYEEGGAIAEALGSHSVVIARDHGIFATGPGIQAALWDMILIDWAAREHLHAIQLGIREAPAHSPETLRKSRTEVRVRAVDAFWRSEIQKLRAARP